MGYHRIFPSWILCACVVYVILKISWWIQFNVLFVSVSFDHSQLYLAKASGKVLRMAGAIPVHRTVQYKNDELHPINIVRTPKREPFRELTPQTTAVHYSYTYTTFVYDDIIGKRSKHLCKEMDYRIFCLNFRLRHTYATTASGDVR